EDGIRYFHVTGVQTCALPILAGKPFEQLVRERVLEPLRMGETSYHVAPERRGRMAAMYEYADGAFTRLPDSPALDNAYREWTLEIGSASCRELVQCALREVIQ